MSFRSTILAVAAIFAFTNAHIIMESPVPYSVDKIDNSPITASQFPCKSQNGFTVSTMNNMAVGEQQTIKFKGTAVHGGGSCQLSVTMDTEPTENSVFKVIKSIEGGCPGIDGATNEYNFELPDSIPNGKATFAWTWFSKMSGAPELYMNCAPIEVTGGASDQTAFSALPDMLVANIGEGCTTAQNFATTFPAPGQAVEKGAANDQEAPVGSCGSTSGTTPAVSSAAPGGASAAPISDAGQYPTAVPSSTAAGEASAAPTPVAPTSAAGQYTSAAASPSSKPDGVFAPGASSAAPVPTNAAPLPSTKTTLLTVTASPSATKPSPAKPTASGTATPAQPTAPASGGSSSSTTCTEDGAIVCNGTTQFGLCNNGQIVWQAVAAGTTCTNGVIGRRAYTGRITRPKVVGSRVVVPGRE